jgi:hypothetical protein
MGCLWQQEDPNCEQKARPTGKAHHQSPTILQASEFVGHNLGHKYAAYDAQLEEKIDYACRPAAQRIRSAGELARGKALGKGQSACEHLLAELQDI